MVAVQSSSQIQSHPVARPSRHAGAKKVGVFCPDWAADGHGAGEHRPIVCIADGNALESLLLKSYVEFKVNHLDDGLQMTQDIQRGLAFYATLLKQGGKVLAGIGIRHVRGKEFDR